MWKLAQPTVVTLVAIAGLLSGVACQSHMVAEGGSTPSHHATHEHEATPSHHGTHHEGSTPEDPCCVLQVADSKTLNPMVLMPEAVEVTAAATVEEPILQLPDAGHALTHEPPGKCSLLHQTCVLLI